VRSFLTGLFTVLAMIGMILAVPAVWTTQKLVDKDGFVASAREAAELPTVRDYFARQIVVEVGDATDIPLTAVVVEPLAKQYTAGPGFVDDFADVAAQQHDWLFTAPEPDESRHVMNLNITPMVNRVIGQVPGHPSVDREITVPVDQNRLTAGSMEDTGTAVTAVSWIAVAVAAIGSLAALILGRRRGTVLAWLGVGGILAGGAGWLLSIYLKHVADDGAADTDLSAQQTVRAVVSHIVDSLTTLSIVVACVGAAVVVLGLVLRSVGGARSPGW